MIESLKLLSIILIPFLLVWLITVLLYRRRHKDRAKMPFKKFISTFDAYHGLGSQPLFWVAIVAPIGLFLSTGVWAWDWIGFDISAKGFNHFIEISKLPLGLLALSIPLAVLTARLHGTKQTALQITKANEQIANTKTQIRATEQKNNTDLYLAHYKHFCEHALVAEELLNNRKLFIGNSTISIDKRFCYKCLYPDSSLTTGIGQLSPDKSYILLRELTSTITSSVRLIERSDKSISDFITLFIEISHQLFCSFSKLHINNTWKELFSHVAFPLPEGEFCYITNFEELIDAVNFMSRITRNIYQFDSNYHHSETDLQLAIMALEAKLQDESVQEVITYLNRTGDGIIPTSELDWSELLETSEVTNNGDKVSATI